MSHHHASYLLGQALEALASISDAVDLDAALAIASTALAGIVPAVGDRPGVERGARASLIGDGAGAPPAATPAAAACATTTPAPSPRLQVVPDVVACEHVRGAYTCTRTIHPGNPNGHVYVSGSWVPDRHQGAS